MERLLFVLIALTAPLAANALEFFACEPEWGSLIEELAGSSENITVATTAFQSPTYTLSAYPLLSRSMTVTVLGML